jgi:hypothetical protein
MTLYHGKDLDTGFKYYMYGHHGKKYYYLCSSEIDRIRARTLALRHAHSGRVKHFSTL